MGDFLVEMRGPGRRILKTLNVPLPVTLKRAEGPWAEQPLQHRSFDSSGGNLDVLLTGLGASSAGRTVSRAVSAPSPSMTTV